jgi:hypothetical protein
MSELVGALHPSTGAAQKIIIINKLLIIDPV